MTQLGMFGTRYPVISFLQDCIYYPGVRDYAIAKVGPLHKIWVSFNTYVFEEHQDQMSLYDDEGTITRDRNNNVTVEMHGNPYHYQHPNIQWNGAPNTAW